LDGWVVVERAVIYFAIGTVVARRHSLGIARSLPTNDQLQATSASGVDGEGRDRPLPAPSTALVSCLAAPLYVTCLSHS
jgi:hypothetical protein